jgi:FKBP-type peptidyl-prolyl cis-trans isomerase
MKNLLFTIALLSIGLSGLLANEIQTNADPVQEEMELASNEDAMLEMLGYMTVYRDGLKELGFGADEAEAIARGLKKALEDEVMDISYQDKMAEFQAFIDKKIKNTEKRRAKARGLQANDNLAQGKEFLDGLKIDESVKSTASGLHYKIIKAGKNKKPKMSDTVRVHYKGTRIDGTVFDSSYKRSQPADFSLQGVVPGFAEGLTKVGEGGKIILFIPSDLAYGNNPRSNGIIQPGDTLIFECELIKINP